MGFFDWLSGVEEARSAYEDPARAAKQLQIDDAIFAGNPDDVIGRESENTTPDWASLFAGLGGGGGGYSGPSAEETQRKKQAQLDNLGGIHGKRNRERNDITKDQLQSIQGQIDANKNTYLQASGNNMKSILWQPQQQRQQSTLMALRNRMGNSAWGSSLVDLAEGMGRVDDMADVELINNWKQNEDNIYNNYVQAGNALLADYSEAVNAARDEQSKAEASYWTAVSDIDPELASEENIKASMAGEESEHGEGTDYLKLSGNKDISLPPELQELFNANKDLINPTNPKTAKNVRDDKQETSYTINPWGGNANRHTAANTAFNDNLDAYRVRVKENPWDTE